MDNQIKKKKITFARFAVRTFAISASTLSILNFLKGEYQAGVLLAFGWLTIVMGEKRMFKGDREEES